MVVGHLNGIWEGALKAPALDLWPPAFAHELNNKYWREKRKHETK